MRLKNNLIQKKNIKKYRFENFGGIISSENPPLLAFVDRNFMREQEFGESPLWENDDKTIGILTAPTEIHFAITNKCSNNCPHCYMDAGEKTETEMDTETFKKALDILSGLHVFHLALGGGEALEREDLFEIAAYTRKKGLVPNLTVSGSKISPDIARKMNVFGQVNVSIDGLDKNYGVFRGKDMFAIADKALDFLIQAEVPTGINCVVGRSNFPQILEIFRYAEEKKVNEIEFLRLKPSGRAGAIYLKEKTTLNQNKKLIPMLSRLSRKYKITAKIDCSFVPMLCYHHPPKKMLEKFGTYGCEAGNVLLGIRSNGIVSGCSFLNNENFNVFDLPNRIKQENYFEHLRKITEKAQEPCASCKYLNICKAGCHAVSEFVTGDFYSPDPDCPFVKEFQE